MKMKMKKKFGKLSQHQYESSEPHPMPFNNEMVDISDDVSGHVRVQFSEADTHDDVSRCDSVTWHICQHR
jgi:hypothetical protein